MATHSNITDLFDDIAEKLQDAKGDHANKIKADDFPSAVAGLRSPATVEVLATTVRTSASATENVASNDRIRIHGSDGKDYTIAEWNALFVAAGYDKDNMTVTPVGLRCQFNDVDEIYMFDKYTGVTYCPSGETAGGAGKLQHSLYNINPITATGSGTDTLTGKAWTITESGNNLVLYEANTKQSWTISKGCGNVNSHRAFNSADRTEALWAQNEWLRHRFAITSGVATTKADGTMGEVQILNASGEQAAIGEDFYFWVKNDSDQLVNTNILAKYNTTNLLTSAIATAIYDKQKTTGVNMNDTGVSSASKHVLCPGAKGAEVIAVDGYWYIVTPYITNPSATTATISNNMPDSPAVYWAKGKGFFLPSDSLLYGIWMNKILCDAAIDYLNNKEGRSISAIPTGDYIWSAVLYSAYHAWLVYLAFGHVNYFSTFIRSFVVGASASND